MHLRRLVTASAVSTLLLLTSCGGDSDDSTKETAQAEQTPGPTDDFQTLVSWMTGSFSSQEQAEADSSFFDIRLQMKRVWADREDGVWLYVEQAAASALDRPYRQRVYHVSEPESGTFRSVVYTLENPLRFAGVWAEPDPLSALTPDSLTERSGCDIVMQREADRFVGSTQGKGCESSLRGASYATSRVRISDEGIYSWDQGFDSSDQQVWGAEKGGYQFKKVADL